MKYKELIMEMLDEIDDEKHLIKIYTVVKTAYRIFMNQKKAGN